MFLFYNRRKDGKWGYPRTLSNGTIFLDGMLKSIAYDSVDLIVSFGIVSARLPYVDYMQPLSDDYGVIFIPYQDITGKIDYHVYWEPFTLNLWKAILVNATIFTICIYAFEWLQLMNMPV